MLARMRPSFLLSCSLALLLAAFSPVQAQIHGTPPSVTSFGFGGSNNPAPGVPASVTSLGPNGFGNGFNGFGNGFGDCCFGPSFTNHPPLFGERRVRDHHRFPIGESTPVYVPYAVPYPVPYAEADPGDEGPVDYPDSRGRPPVYDRGPGYRDAETASRPASHEPAPKAAAAPDPAEPSEPVAAQPATVLIFKDGHKSEVQNYAIVGTTLFDFSDGRSHKILLADLDLPATLKANEDRGVDFQIPAKAAQASQKK